MEFRESKRFDSKEELRSHVGVNINLQSARINLSGHAFMSFTPQKKRKRRGEDEEEDGIGRKI